MHGRRDNLCNLFLHQNKCPVFRSQRLLGPRHINSKDGTELAKILSYLFFLKMTRYMGNFKTCNGPAPGKLVIAGDGLFRRSF